MPIALVSGDDALAREVRSLLGDGVRMVVVKEAVSRHSAQSVAPEAACGMIREAMQGAVSKHLAGASGLRPFLVSSPMTVEVDFAMTVHADHAAMAPGFERTGPRTAAFRHEDYREVFRAFRTMFNLGGMD